MNKKIIIPITIALVLIFWGIWFEIEFNIFSNEFIQQRQIITQSVCNKKDKQACISADTCLWLENQENNLLLDCGFSADDYCGPACISKYSDAAKPKNNYSDFLLLNP